ncbi:ABC transporter substrate-binding protein [Desulfosarcina sp. OttesenSCG-928-A07]|nr:ABC transporter substrate-binding protein [Desulfosarcina sp. OttesenSCG-928-A07]
MQLPIFCVRTILLILLTLTSTVLGICPSVMADETVTYRLKWLINASTAGDVVALHQNCFAREGLDVTLKPGGPERDAIRELELGYAQFGVASADQVIRAMDKGAKVVVVAQLFQVNPLQWIYRPADISIQTPVDLAGKTVGITYGGNDEAIMRALLSVSGLKEDKVRLASVRYDYTPFFQKKIPIWPVYGNLQGILLEEKLRENGEAAAFLDPAAFGIRFVANSVVTSQKMMDDDPDTVRRFVSALLEGWKMAMDPAHGEDTMAVLSRYDKDTPDALLRRQIAVTRKLVQPDPALPIGHIDIAAWEATEAIMVKQGLIEKPVGIGKGLRP